MKETEFNLLDEPWIRVMDAQCKVQEMSLTDVLIHAHEYKSLSGELPTQDVAILRLLLAVLHTVFARVDARGNPHRLEDEEEAVEFWHELWEQGKLPEQPIRTYLEQWHERFWLFHPERPFAQVADLKCNKRYETAKLNGEISESGNKKRLFSSYCGSLKSSLTYAQAARWLISLKSFDDNALKETTENKTLNAGKEKGKSPGVGWLGKLGIVYLCGDTLFETLLLNLVLVNDGNVQNRAVPLWERPNVPYGERIEIVMPDNLAELYTLESRRVLLMREQDKVNNYMVIFGDFFEKTNAFFEPMTIWNVPKAKKNQQPDYIPKCHEPSKQMWREFSVIYEHSAKKTAGVIRWFKEFLVDKIDRSYMMRTRAVSVYYLGSQNSAVENIFFDTLSFHARILSELGADLRSDIQTEIQKCEQLANAVGHLARHLHIAEGGSDNSCEFAVNTAKEQLYYHLDMPFREWLVSIEPDEDGDVDADIFPNWQKTAQNIAFRYARELCEYASDAAMTGHLIGRDGEKKVLYSAPNAIRIFGREVYKIYQTLR
ncbi:MAG: type I-E CRISPR-associated protein Cse1/CasA [Ruminococcus sp.]|nr:type I-E CRISPR-associated protein Cse1/CasA [Ruminococcus sp.]